MSTAEPSLDGGDSVRPLVASAPSNRVLWVFGAALLGGGALLFHSLENRREAMKAPAITVPADTSAGYISAPPDLAVPPTYRNNRYSTEGYDEPDWAYAPARPTNPAPVTTSPTPHARSAASPPASAPAAMLSPVPPLAPPAGNAMQEVYRTSNAQQNTPEAPTLDNGSGPASGKDRVEAIRFANPATTVPKGTVIQAVLETAVDSNRAGFARAIVSRDIFGFDGSRVLIPRGSRIIGEYKSDVALGQNRVLIQWQRLMRPDGIVINMDSPSADPLGRAGIKGKVNTHFFQRFAGSILQSALDIGVQLATREATNNAVYVGLPGLAQGMVVTPEKIPPTVKIRQGRSVSVFVARDLDFTKVGA